jgi:DNA helicase-2/ATP-dependent DNA helicase PcrA
MRERIDHLLTQYKLTDTGTPCMKTFHSLGVYLLRKFGTVSGQNNRFTILDDGDTLALIKESITSFGYDTKMIEPRAIKSLISNAQNKGSTESDLLGSANPTHRMAGQIWGKYKTLKKKNNALDFDDLLFETKELLTKKSDVLAWCHNQWHYIHIDEYQDTNIVQYEIARLLAEHKKNICVVGDGDQSIYSWRGANIQNILTFEHEYSEATTILLEENYRSTQTVLDAANETIKKNKHRKEKRLFTSKGFGDPITLYGAYDEHDEGSYIVSRVVEELDRGVSPDQICILYRTNFQSRILEQSFLAMHIPYQLLGVRFFERKEIKDILSYVRLILNNNSTLDLKRIINTPPRGIGKVTLEKILDRGLTQLSGRALVSAQTFFNTLQELRIYSEMHLPSEIIKKIIEKNGFIEYYKEQPDGQEHIENLQELVSQTLSYNHKEGIAGLEALLEDATLMSDQDNLGKSGKMKGESGGGVKLMTIHASKGLEFDIVFICGLEQGLFPHERDKGVAGPDGEEERRLMYVALTRARKKIYLTYASFRTIYGARDVRLPSEFLNDIPDELMERDTRKGEFGNGSGGGYTIYLD